MASPMRLLIWNHDTFSVVLALISRIFFAFIAFLMLIATYRLTFHPLATYPGPIFAKLSGIWMAYHAYQGDSHLVIQKLHQKHGKFVRIGPSSLTINSNTALETIYGFRANVQKGKLYTTWPANPKAHSTFTCIDKKIHARKRRTLAHGFTESSLRALDPTLISCIEGIIKQFQAPEDNKSWGPVINVEEIASSFQFDVMGSVVFGRSFNMLEDPKQRWLKDAVQARGRINYTVGNATWLHHTGLGKWIFPGLVKNRDKLSAWAIDQMKTRMEEGQINKKADSVDFMQEGKDPETGEGFTTKELGSESVTLVTAGSDTSATALAASLFYLSHSQHSLHKLNDELRTAFSPTTPSSSGLIVPGPTLSSCTYLHACVTEALRLSPPVPSALPREVLHGGMVIDQEYVPAGMEVSVSIYTVMRNSEYYREPTRFLPERWIVGAEMGGDQVTEESVRVAQSAFCAFSVGPRSCVAKGLAYAELLLAVGRMVWELEMRGVEEKDGVVVGMQQDGTYEIQDFLIAKNTGPMMQFKRRELVGA